MVPCTITCFIATVIIVSMIIMSLMVSYDPYITSYESLLPTEAKQVYKQIVAERSSIYYTGYFIGFLASALLIFMNTYVLKNRMPVSAMVCLAIVISTLVNYFYYTLHPKSNYLVSHLKTDEQKANWLKMYKSMQYYYHASFVLGAVAVGVFAYAFRGGCR